MEKSGYEESLRPNRQVLGKRQGKVNLCSNTEAMFSQDKSDIEILEPGVEADLRFNCKYLCTAMVVT
jgi:hypothetical protein